MLSYVFGTLVFVPIVAANTFATYDVPSVQTSSGLLKGFSPADGIHAYVGIRYAQPPVGDFRFEPPQAFKPNDPKVLVDVTKAFPSCYQVQYDTFISDKSTAYAESEDCLYVNVWKPANVQNSKGLPVLVNIYGGGFSQGGTTTVEGVDFVTDQKDIIYVSFNYRLNIFGFPNGPAIKTKNVGLLDQRLAFEWIRNNIAAFGGDANRMTVIGESAGSESISYHAYAFPDDPIFNGMILWSGQPQSSLPQDTTSWARIANQTKCANCESPVEELACMKSQPPRVLRRAISPSNLLKFAELTGGVPVMDNKTMFTYAEYDKRGMAGEFAHVPMWVSNTREEGDNLIAWDPYTTNGTGVNYTESDFLTLATFHCPTAAAAEYSFANNLPIYRTTYSGTFPPLEPYPWARAYHGIDIYHLYFQERYGAYQELGPEIEKAGRVLRNAVGAFVRDPVNGLKNFGWPMYNPDQPTIINMFPNNTEQVFLENPKEFDAICESLKAR